MASSKQKPRPSKLTKRVAKKAPSKSPAKIPPSKKAGAKLPVLSLHQQPEYKTLLTEIKLKLKAAQLRAAAAVNQQLLQFYWEIGKLILDKQQASKWGDKLINALETDLRASFPDTEGFSRTNLKYMRRFAEAYPTFKIGQTLSGQLPWSHHIALMTHVNGAKAREWYTKQAVANGWGYRQFVSEMKSDLYARQAKKSVKTSNYLETLSAPHSTLANETLKDPYKFHFLTIGDDAHEQAVERGLIAHITQFMLELGQSFAYVGNQYPLSIDGREFRLDLLFYHLKLRSYVVIELKKGEFKPEYAGKLNFYLSAVDELLKQPHDNPTIGILLCEKKNKIFAEYALRDIKKPIGISEYHLSKVLPKKLQPNLPTIEELEAELNTDRKKRK